MGFLSTPCPPALLHIPGPPVQGNITSGDWALHINYSASITSLTEAAPQLRFSLPGYSSLCQVDETKQFNLFGDQILKSNHMASKLNI